MCGIVGVIGAKAAAQVLLEALRRLEYRGYDSAGIATLVNGHIECRRAAGKLVNLTTSLDHKPLPGTVGIGHTRWATHGEPSESNAHPHGTPRVSIVHNGIIENHAELRAELEAVGQEFTSSTDTEVVAQLADLYLQRGMDPWTAAIETCKRLRGAYAFVMIFAGESETFLFGAQYGAPLAIGQGIDEMFVGSDALGLVHLTQKIAYMKDGDRVRVTSQGAEFFDESGASVVREFKLTSLNPDAIGKDGNKHYMLKELRQHPEVILETVSKGVNDAGEVVFPDLGIDFATLPRISMASCGSSCYAAHTGRYWIEGLARIPCDIDYASEFRYREPPMQMGGLGLLISQSGTTADTLAALRYMKENGQHILTMLNVRESSMDRESDSVLENVAGPEIAVASTKAFTAQLTALALLAIFAARVRGKISHTEEVRLTTELKTLAGRVAFVLQHLDHKIQDVAEMVTQARDVLYLGRHSCYPIALEGALKLKEVAYIHAEGYAAGEMKHGPIALIDRLVPIIAIAPSGPLFGKVASNVEEAAARGGQIIVFSDAAGAEKLKHVAKKTIIMPTVDPFVAPILYAVAMHLMAYDVAVLRGTDVDQPRNLAKSVTVE